MVALEVVQSINAALELANHVKLDAAKAADARRVEHLRAVNQALRRIYFSPRGVVALLELIAKGLEPTEAQIAAILPDFNDFEYRMGRFIDRLDPEHEHGNAHLTLKAERLLREIAYGKRGVREGVQALLNEALTRGERIAPEDASDLLKQIRQLNTAIEDAEEALVLNLK